jgi:predicted small lipoprotein YifL
MINISGILGFLPGTSRSVAVTAMLATGLLLSACGQKGPLFLPPAGSQSAPAKPAPTESNQPGNKTVAQPPI